MKRISYIKLIYISFNYKTCSHIVLKCKKDTESVDSRILKTKDGRPFLSSKSAACGSTKSRFMKEQEAKRIIKQFRS